MSEFIVATRPIEDVLNDDPVIVALTKIINLVADLHDRLDQIEAKLGIEGSDAS